jgi:hypothetical protein
MERDLRLASIGQKRRQGDAGKISHAPVSSGATGKSQEKLAIINPDLIRGTLMPAIKPVPAPAPAVRSEPAPVYQTPEPERMPSEDPPAPLLALVKAALARTDAQLAQWAGGNTQFEATRFMMNGQFNALRAVARALEGDPKALEGL